MMALNERREYAQIASKNSDHRLPRQPLLKHGCVPGLPASYQKPLAFACEPTRTMNELGNPLIEGRRALENAKLSKSVIQAESSDIFCQVMAVQNGGLRKQ
jgi:hypothetical protein